MIASTEPSNGYEEKVNSAGKLYFARNAASKFAGAGGENVRFASGNAEGAASVKPRVSAAGTVDIHL